MSEAAPDHVAAAVPAGEAPAEQLPRKYGKYTLLRKLATGGMAELYLALHRSVAGFEKLVVIKRILPEMGKDQAFITMLLQEARIAATFSHPNIVTTFDVGQAEGQYFIAMEHIHGEDLRSIVRAMKPKSVTEFPLEHAIALVMGIAAGLAYAHEKTDLNGNPLHIVHRDISPQNVLVTFTGDVKVVDFGIAKASGNRRPTDTAPPGVSGERLSSAPGGDEHKTRDGQLKGKLPYMSPEQARGEDIDHRTDIFATGVILFELSTGRRLFRGTTEMDTVKMITEMEYPSPSAINPRISAGLERVIVKALAKSREERYQSARDLQADLESVARDERIPVSNVALGKWMEMLFEERLAAQRQALLEGKQLADVLASEEPPESFTNVTGPSVVTAPPAKRWPYLAALLVIALLAVVGTVYLNKRSEAARLAHEAEVNSGTIVVHSVPEGASIWLDGRTTGQHTPYTLANLPTGAGVHHSVELRFDAYAPYTQDVPLAAPHAHGEVTGMLQHNVFGVLEVSTIPHGATVIIDGHAVPGTTPLTVPNIMPDASHHALVQLDGYQDENFDWTATAGQVEHRPIVLRERPLGADEAMLVVHTEPASARVHIDNRDFDWGGPYRIRVHTTDHLTLNISASGYESTSRPVLAQPGQTQDLTIRLEHEHAHGGSTTTQVSHDPGTLTVGATPWCNVTVDGVARGQTPIVHLSLPAGSHSVVCSNPQRGTQSRSVTVSPGQETRTRIVFP